MSRQSTNVQRFGPGADRTEIALFLFTLISLYLTIEKFGSHPERLVARSLGHPWSR